MPRLARLDAPGVIHHVIIRGIERRKIFRDNKDRNDMMERLGDLLPATKTACYVLPRLMLAQWNIRPACPVKREACLSGVKCLPNGIRRPFHRGGAYFSGAKSIPSGRRIFHRGSRTPVLGLSQIKKCKMKLNNLKTFEIGLLCIFFK